MLAAPSIENSLPNALNVRFSNQALRVYLMRRLGLLIIDLTLIVLATLAAQLLRDNLEVVQAHFPPLSTYLAVTVAIALPVVLAFRLDRTLWRFSSLADYQRVVMAACLIVGAAVAVGFLANRQEGVSRSLPLIQLMIMSLAMVGARVVSRVVSQRRAIARPRAAVALDTGQETVLILGLNATADFYVRALSDLAPTQVKIAGLLGREAHHTGRLLQQYPVLGRPEDVDSIVRDLGVHGVTVDRIVVTFPVERLPASAREALLAIERASTIKLDFLADRLTAPLEPGPATVLARAANASLPGAAGTPLPHPGTSDTPRPTHAVDIAGVEPSTRRLYWRIKRGIDIFVSSTMLVLLAPMMVILSVAVAIDIGFPAVFWQQRPGRFGQPFRLYKFRTMASAHDAAGRRIPDADRSSRLGRLMRRWRLDELPQLFNILFGDMSFVGPRPLLPVDQFDEFQARLLVAPGLTGWAQVRGGRTIGAVDKAALDVWYICNASFALDARIVLATLPMLVTGDRTDRAAVGRAWADLTRARHLRPSHPQGGRDAVAERGLASPRPQLRHAASIKARAPSRTWSHPVDLSPPLPRRRILVCCPVTRP